MSEQDFTIIITKMRLRHEASQIADMLSDNLDFLRYYIECLQSELKDYEEYYKLKEKE